MKKKILNTILVSLFIISIGTIMTMTCSSCSKVDDDNIPGPSLNYELSDDVSHVGDILTIDASKTEFSQKYPDGYLVVDINKPDTTIITESLVYSYTFETPGEYKFEFLVREYGRGWGTIIAKHKVSIK